MKSSRTRFLIVIVAATLFAALGLWTELTTWNRLVQSSNNRLIETASAIALYSDDVFALAEQPLAELARKAQAALGDDAATIIVLDDMNRQMRTSAVLRSIDYIGPDGRLVGSTLVDRPAGMDVVNREHAAFHSTHDSPDIHIGMAARSPSTGGWSLPVSRRINGPDGRFAGIMVASITLDRFSKFMESFNLGGDSAFFLMRADGRVVLRYPFKPQAMRAGLGDTDFFSSQGAVQKEGNYEYQAPQGKGSRLSGFFLSEQTGVIAIATRSKTALFHHWITRTQYPWLSMIAAYLVGLAITFRWLHQIRLREIGERKVAAREAEFRLIANSSTDVIEKIAMNGMRQYVSPAAATIFEQSPAALVGTNVLDKQDEAGRTAWESALVKLQAGSTSQTILLERTRSDGTRTWLESVLSRVHAQDGEEPDGIVVVTRDVTRQEMAKKELDALAITDELTGLFNKRHFSSQIKLLLARETAVPLSLLLLDLDRFKQFNDNYGHLAGDGCLRDVALALREALQGKHATAARFGGEELAVLLPGCDEAASLSIAEDLRHRIESLRIRHTTNQPSGVVTVSIGAATLAPEHRRSADALIKAADEALYGAKHLGRNRVVSAADSADIKLAASAS